MSTRTASRAMSAARTRASSTDCRWPEDMPMSAAPVSVAASMLAVGPRPYTLTDISGWSVMNASAGNSVKGCTGDAARVTVWTLTSRRLPPRAGRVSTGAAIGRAHTR